MKVLIVGSLVGAMSESDKTSFAEACREIGRVLAEAGHEIVIGSEQIHTADRQVLEGAVTTGKKIKVAFVRPATDVTPYLDSLSPDQLNVRNVPLRGNWSAGRVPQILAADVVLLIGGGAGTATTGYLAPELEKPVLAIPSFGGAANELYGELLPTYHQYPYLKEQLGMLSRSWSTQHPRAVLSLLTKLVDRRAFKKSPRLPLTLYMTMLVACLIAWVWVFANPLSPRIYSFFLMVGLAGLLGTILRNNLRMMFDPTATFTWNDLFIEIGAGLLLGFALALLYLTGALAVTGTTLTITSPQDADFQRIAVVMTLLGLGGGLMIETAAERIRNWFTSGIAASATVDRN